MSEQLIDGRGNAYAVGVTSDNRLMTDAALTLSGAFSLNNSAFIPFVARSSGTIISLSNDVEAFQIQNIGTVVPMYYLVGSVTSGACLTSGALVYAQESVSIRLNVGSGNSLTFTGSNGTDTVGRFMALW